MMMNENDIRQLIGRFLQAETTLEEEQALYEYFQGEEVANDLEPYREAFQGFAAVKGIDMPVTKTRTPAWVIALRTVTTAAAVFLVGLFFFVKEETPDIQHPTSSTQKEYRPYTCEGSTPRELYTCFLERKREQPKTYSIIKQKIYENEH